MTSVVEQPLVAFTRSSIRPREATLFAMAGATSMNGELFFFQSWLEYTIFCVLNMDPSVTRVQTQPRAVHVEIAGQMVRRTFDLLAVRSDRSVWLIAVRPEAHADNVRREVAEIVKQCSDRGHFCGVMTEKSLCPVVAENARELHEARYEDPEADARLARRLKDLTGPIALMHLAALVGLGGAYHAILRAVERGDLSLVRATSRFNRPNCMLKLGAAR